MSDVVDVSPDVLRRHAASVRSLMAQLSEATTDASSTVDLHIFGRIAIDLAAFMQRWSESANGLIDTAVAAGRFICDEVTAMAENYALVEDEATGSFTMIESSLRPRSGS